MKQKLGIVAQFALNFPGTQWGTPVSPRDTPSARLAFQNGPKISVLSPSKSLTWTRTRCSLSNTVMSWWSAAITRRTALGMEPTTTTSAISKNVPRGPNSGEPNLCLESRPREPSGNFPSTMTSLISGWARSLWNSPERSAAFPSTVWVQYNSSTEEDWRRIRTKRFRRWFSGAKRGIGNLPSTRRYRFRLERTIACKKFTSSAERTSYRK